MKTMTKTAISGLVGIIFSATATAAEKDGDDVQLELFAHNQGVLTETKVSGTWHGITYAARNRLSVSYDGTVQEFLLQELYAPAIFGVRPVAQAVLKDAVLLPQAGLQYQYKAEDFSFATRAVWQFQENPLVELRIAGSYTHEKYAVEAENFLWFTAEQISGTARAHIGYTIAPFQIGIAGELAYPALAPVAGLYGRVKF